MAKKDAITDAVVWRHIFETARRLSPEHWAICLILYETGMHIESLVNLRAEWIFPEKMRWERPKVQARQRWLQYPMNRTLAFALAEFQRHPRKTRFTYYRMVKQVGRAAGRPDLAPMTFRHTRAVRYLKQGLPAMWIEVMMGASAAVIKSSYGSLTPEQLLEAQRKAVG